MSISNAFANYWSNGCSTTRNSTPPLCEYGRSRFCQLSLQQWQLSSGHLPLDMHLNSGFRAPENQWPQPIGYDSAYRHPSRNVEAVAVGWMKSLLNERAVLRQSNV